MARRFAYLTPDTNETQTIVSRCLSVPLPLLPHVVGALSELTNVWRWEQFGTMSPEDAAQLATVMLNDFSEDCDAMTCEEIIQCVLASGILQTVSDDALKRVVDGVPQWSPDGVTWYDMPLVGDGTPNVPPLQSTSGANDDAKICLAATRAVLVINELYGGVFGAVGNGLHTALNDFSRFLRELNHSLLGLLYGESWQIVNAAILQDVDVETHYVNPSLAETVLEEFLCLLVNNAAVDATGIVTFDYGAVRANVVSATNLIDGTAIWGLLGYIGADGLNVAGSTNITSTAMDCAPCMPAWCHEFDFTIDQQGFAVSPGWAAQWLTGSPPLGNGWYSVPSAGPSYRLSIYIDFETTLIESVELTYRVGQVASGGYRAIDLFNGVYTPASEVASQPLNTGSTGDTFITTELETSVYADRLRLWLDTDEVSSGSYNTIRSVVVRGRGVNPWTDNC